MARRQALAFYARDIRVEGPHPLWSSGGNPGNGRTRTALRRIAEACGAHGKLARESAETAAQIEEYWRLGCKVLNLLGTDVSTYLDGLKARAGRAHARLRSIGVPVP